jgi:acyl-CoA oxidase
MVTLRILSSEMHCSVIGLCYLAYFLFLSFCGWGLGLLNLGAAFIAQIRSLDDHIPLPNVTVGDIGVKFGNGGYNSMDNGLLRFDHVRIPRENMLMKLARVTEQGKYERSNKPRQLGYGAMVFIRQGIVAEASVYLSRAVTIAVRYSAVRRQFGGKDDKAEVQV